MSDLQNAYQRWFTSLTGLADAKRVVEEEQTARKELAALLRAQGHIKNKGTKRLPLSDGWKLKIVGTERVTFDADKCKAEVSAILEKHQEIPLAIVKYEYVPVLNKEILEGLPSHLKELFERFFTRVPNTPQITLEMENPK